MAANTLVWLRNDLRTRDNPALSAAIQRGGPVVAVHVEETNARLRKRGAASRWWLHQSLGALTADLAAMGVTLETRSGSILDSVRDHQPAAVYWNRRYGPAEREIDAEIKAALRKDGVEAESFAGNALVEPVDIATKAGSPYAVYTPFWHALHARDIPAPLPTPHQIGPAITPPMVDSIYVTPAWAQKLARYWKPGEASARKRLSDFFERIEGYPEGRDFPARDATSRLSPHLAHGEISVRQVWHAAVALAEREPGKAGPVQKFLMELAWRDFNIHQLYHREDLATVPMQPRFRQVTWRRSEDDLRAWQRGETGIAIVDAGMNELWETGFMHNRVRMLTASLLAKNLLLDWRLGEQWFWDCLVDADGANNAGNWQWIAGCGNDAAPYFRIFNPDLQAKRFDPDRTYVDRWAPESRAPIVDLKSSRERALAALRAAS